MRFESLPLLKQNLAGHAQQQRLCRLLDAFSLLQLDPAAHSTSASSEGGGVFDIRPICPNKGEYLTVTVWMPRQGDIEENWRYLLASPVGLPANWRMCCQLPGTGATLSRLTADFVRSRNIQTNLLSLLDRCHYLLDGISR